MAAIAETSLMFLVHATLTAAEIDKTCDVLREVGRRAPGNAGGVKFLVDAQLPGSLAT